MPPGAPTRRLLRSLALASVVCALSCKSADPEIVVRITSDMTVGRCGTLVGVRVDISGTSLAQSFPLDGTTALRDLPIELGITTSRSTPGLASVTVTALLAGGGEFAVEARAPYPAAGEASVLEVFLPNRCRTAAPTDCSVGTTTCGRSGCEPIVRPSLPHYAALPSPDAGRPPRPTCP